ncbi:MAG TPA: hypothetical protein VIE65_04160 [Methylobacter sp.]|jgi:hypothetical protein
MTIQDFIAKLEQIKADHGAEVEIAIGHPMNAWLSGIETIDVNTYANAGNLNGKSCYVVLTPYEDALDVHGTGGDLDEPVTITSYCV